MALAEILISGLEFKATSLLTINDKARTISNPKNIFLVWYNFLKEIS